MPSTPNKGLSVPNTGTEVNLWGDDLNANSFGTLDLNLGGLHVESLTNVNIDLDPDDSKNCIVRLIGTLTGNVLVRTMALGFTMVENLATVGAFSVTFAYQSGGVTVGTPITIPANSRAVVLTDATNGARVCADNQVEFASGTALIFPQANAPAGWTAQATNEAAIRVVSSGGGDINGSVNFTSAFASQPVAGTVNPFTLTINEIPSHSHTVTSNGTRTGSASQNPGANFYASSGDVADFGGKTMTSTAVGNGQGHNHSFSGTPINLAVRYLDALHCIKN